MQRSLWQARKARLRRLFELTVEKKWLEGYIDGLSKFIAFSKNDTFEQSQKEYEEIKNIFKQKEKELEPIALKWREKLKEALSK